MAFSPQRVADCHSCRTPDAATENINLTVPEVFLAVERPAFTKFERPGFIGELSFRDSKLLLPQRCQARQEIHVLGFSLADFASLRRTSHSTPPCGFQPGGA
jgi:hypothetical protein